MKELTEDRIIVLARVFNNKEIFTYIYDEAISLSFILDNFELSNGYAEEIIVIAENPSNGRVFRYDGLKNEWKMVGVTLGYE